MADVLASLTTIPLGPCKVIFDVGGTTQYIIDRTKGGCHFKSKFNTEDITMDQTGDTTLDMLLTKVEAVFEVPLVTADLEMIQKLTPNSTLYTDAGTPAKKAMEVVATAGISLLPNAKKVRLEPLNGTEAQHITLFKAVAVPDVDNVYGPKDAQIMMVRFVGLPDPGKRNHVYCRGPETVLPV